MEFDAFDEGIELGGLRNRDEIRLFDMLYFESR